MSPGDTEEDPGLVHALRIVPLAERSDLIPVVAGWHWREWGHGDAHGSHDSWTDALRRRARGEWGDSSWVALADGEPVGSVELRRHDMTTHGELSPWLSSVFVVPARRGRGIGRSLIEHGESAAAARGVAVLYLYTTDAEPLYRRRGWEVVVREPYGAEVVTIMRKRLRAL